MGTEPEPADGRGWIVVNRAIQPSHSLQSKMNFFKATLKNIFLIFTPEVILNLFKRPIFSLRYKHDTEEETQS